MSMAEQVRKHRRKIALGIAGGVLGLAVVLLEAGGGGDPGDEVRTDARRLHCLSKKQRPELVQAAVRLGEAAPGSTEAELRPMSGGRETTPVTLDEWSRRSPAAFARACEPLAALSGSKTLQDPAPKPPLWQRIGTNPLVTLVIGSLLAFASTHATARTARRETLADQLNTAAAEYLKAAEAMRRARLRGGAIDEEALDGRRLVLWSAILRIPLPPADGRELDALLGRAHEALKAVRFDDARALHQIQQLSDALAKALRGERVIAEAAAGPAESTPGAGT